MWRGFKLFSGHLSLLSCWMAGMLWPRLSVCAPRWPNSFLLLCVTAALRDFFLDLRYVHVLYMYLCMYKEHTHTEGEGEGERE